MIYVRRISGQSMLPLLRPGQVCVFVRQQLYQHGDIVCAMTGQREVVKQLHILGDELYLMGKNPQMSNNYEITHDRIKGKLVWPRLNLGK